MVVTFRAPIVREWHGNGDGVQDVAFRQEIVN